VPRIVPVLETETPRPTPSPAPTPALPFVEDEITPAPAGPPVYVIVPFGDPDDTNPVFRDGTAALTRDLTERHIRSTLSTPLDALEAVGTAPRLCADYRGAGLLVGQLSFEQKRERDLTGFIPFVGGIVSSSGVFDALPIRARFRLYQVDCRGHVVWKTTALANKVHHGQNVEAGLTQIALQAIATASEEFRIRPRAEPERAR